ncbi:MAG: hypothetical protein AAGG75_02955 [Bacteroidota bacterium]
MKNALQEELDVEKIMAPESSIERRLLDEPSFRRGLLWGKPRFGHPEGKIVLHIREVLDNIDQLNITDNERHQLRLIAYAHDTFKYQEIKGHPRDWSQHHGKIARRFMTQYSDDSTILDIIDLHDEAYYSWRHTHVYRDSLRGQNRLESLLNQIGANIQLYYLFFKCDTRTGDKNQSPLKWFENNVPGIDIVDF